MNDEDGDRSYAVDRNDTQDGNDDGNGTTALEGRQEGDVDGTGGVHSDVVRGTVSVRRTDKLSSRVLLRVERCPPAYARRTDDCDVEWRIATVCGEKHAAAGRQWKAFGHGHGVPTGCGATLRRGDGVQTSK